MSIKRLLAILLIACMFAAMTVSCANNGGKPEQAQTEGLPAESGETETAGGNMTYMSEKIAPPEGSEYALNNAVASGNMIFMSDNETLWCMGKDGTEIQEVYTYAPLEGYLIGKLGTAYGGGLLVVEQNGRNIIISKVLEDGTVDSVTDITEAVSIYPDFYPMKLFSDRDGYIYVQLSDSALVISADGKQANIIALDVNSTFSSIALSGEGGAYVCVHEPMNFVYTVYELNQDGTVGRMLTEIPGMQLNPQLFNGGESFGLFYSDFNGLYAINMENGTSELLFEWVTHGLTGPFVFDIWDVSDRVLLCRNYDNYLYLFTEGIETERMILKLAIYGESFLLSQLISDFNNRSDKYKVVVEDYSKYDEGEEGAGLTKLNTEIQAGNIPDIIDFSHIPARYYEEKGLLADLYPYIDADPEIERSDLFSAYLNTYERDGALYRALQFFSIFCFVGKSDIVGTEHGWTLEEMLRLQSEFAPDAPGMGGMTRGQAVNYYLNSIYGDFIDWETGACSFDSEGFVRILEYIATLDENLAAEDTYLENLINGGMIVYPVNMFNIYYLMTYDVVFGEEEYTYKGIPANGKNGIVLYENNSPSLGITSACPDKEGAWSFVRMLLSEYVVELNNGIRVNKKAMDAILDKAMTDNKWINEDGEEIIGIKMNGLGVNGLEPEDLSIAWDIVLYAATREQANRYLELIENCDMVWNRDETIRAIVEEALGPFFAGDKTARETADIIQSRAQVYVSEHMG